MLGVTASQLDESEDLLRYRLSSLQDQYENLNTLAAQASMGVANMTASNVPVVDENFLVDPNYNAEKIRNDMSLISQKQMNLQIKYQEDLALEFSTFGAVRQVRQTYQSAVPVPSSGGGGGGGAAGSTNPATARSQLRGNTASGSMKRRKTRANAARRAKKDEALSSAPLSFPVFPGFNSLGEVRVDDIKVHTAGINDGSLEGVRNASSANPSREQAETANLSTAAKRKKNSRATGTVSENISKKAHTLEETQPSRRGGTKGGKKAPIKPTVAAMGKDYYNGSNNNNNNNNNNSGSSTNSRKASKRTKVAFGSTITTAKNQIKVAKKKSRRIGNDTESIVKAVARAAEISAAAAEQEIIENRNRLADNERELAELRDQVSRFHSHNPHPASSEFAVDQWGQVTEFQSEAKEQYRVMEVTYQPKVSILSPSSSYDFNMDTASSPLRRSKSSLRSPARSVGFSDHAADDGSSKAPPPSVIPTSERQTKASLHLANPAPILINSAFTQASPPPTPTRTPNSAQSSVEFTLENPNDILHFTKYEPDDAEQKQVEDEQQRIQEPPVATLPPPVECALHPVKPKGVASNPTGDNKENARAINIKPDAEALLDVIVSDTLADEAAQLIMRKPRITAREATEGEKYARTMSLLEKTAEIQQQNAIREKSIADREASLIGMEKTIKEFLSKPFQPLPSSPRLKPAANVGSMSNPNSGSIQLQASSSGDSMKPMIARIGQGRSLGDSSSITSGLKKGKVDWSAVSVAPGASFEAELNEAPPCVNYGDEVRAKAVLIMPGEYNPDNFARLKEGMESEVAAALDVDRGCVTVENILKGSILFELVVVSDGAFNAADKMKHLHDICANGQCTTKLLSRVVGVADSKGGGPNPFRTNFSRLLRGGETFQRLPLKQTVVPNTKLFTILQIPAFQFLRQHLVLG